MDNQPPNSQTLPTPGGAWNRYFAGVADAIFLGTVQIGLVVIWLLISKNNLISNTWLFAILGFSYSIFMLLNYGATFGKQLYGLTVIQYDTKQRVNIRGALLREAVKNVLFLIPFVGIIPIVILGISIASSPERRGFHDKIAGTQVLKVKPSWSLLKQFMTFGVALAILIAEFVLLNNLAPETFKR